MSVRFLPDGTPVFVVSRDEAAGTSFVGYFSATATVQTALLVDSANGDPVTPGAPTSQPADPDDGPSLPSGQSVADAASSTSPLADPESDALVLERARRDLSKLHEIGVGNNDETAQPVTQRQVDDAQALVDKYQARIDNDSAELADNDVAADPVVPVVPPAAPSS